MDSPENLVATIVEEDRLLRESLARCSKEFWEITGPSGSLSCKETLGHLAFWDDFTVEFFLQRLDTSTPKPEPPLDFEKRSRHELERVRDLTWLDVLEHYTKATGRLLDFLEEHWRELTDKQRRDFQVPLKHRRHHRLKLARMLSLWDKSPSSEQAGEA